MKASKKERGFMADLEWRKREVLFLKNIRDYLSGRTENLLW